MVAFLLPTGSLSTSLCEAILTHVRFRKGEAYAGHTCRVHQISWPSRAPAKGLLLWAGKKDWSSRGKHMLYTPAWYTKSAGPPEPLQKVYFSGQAKRIGAQGWKTMTKFLLGRKPSTPAWRWPDSGKGRNNFPGEMGKLPNRGIFKRIPRLKNVNQKSVPEERINPNRMIDVQTNLLYCSVLFCISCDLFIDCTGSAS